MHQNAFGGRTRWGSLSAPPDPLAAKRGPTSKGKGEGREGKGKVGEGKGRGGTGEEGEGTGGKRRKGWKEGGFGRTNKNTAATALFC